MKMRFLILFMLTSFSGVTQNYNLTGVDYQNIEIPIDCSEISYDNLRESFPLIFVDSISIEQLKHHCLIPFENSSSICLTNFDIFIKETKQVFELYNDRDISEDELLHAFINNYEIYKLGRVFSRNVYGLESFLVVVFYKDENFYVNIKIYALNFSTGKLKSIIKVAEKMSSIIASNMRLNEYATFNRSRLQEITLKLIARTTIKNHSENFDEITTRYATINEQGFVVIKD